MQPQEPAISVVMSVYNGEKYIEDTIESILNQTFENFEFIIINDCSTDSSLEILEAFRERDTRVVIINNDINLKLPASLNKGIAKARGCYIARMDADDIALPNRFAVQLQAIESEPEIDFLGSRVQCFYDEENDGEAYADISSMEELHFNFIAESLDLKDTQELITKESYKTTRICHSTLFGKTSAFKKLKYNEEVFAEDWDLYNRAINRGYSISKVPDVLVKYRIVNTGMCGQFNNQNHKEIRKKISTLNNGILKDCFVTKNYDNAFKFLWFHYIRFFLANLIVKFKIMVNKMIKRPVFLVMKLVYKSLPDVALMKLYRFFSILDRRTPIGKIPLVNRVLSLSLLVLRNNEIISASLKEKLNKEVSINIGIWTIEKKWAMGGLNTILKMLPKLIENKENIRIVNYGLHTEELKKDFLSFLPEITGLETSVVERKVEVVSASTYRNQVKEFSTDDKFIAGFWESAEDFIKYRKLNHFKTSKFAYVIQDYEPSMLYRWGSEYIRSKSTLEDNNYYPIFNNSVFVCGYMRSLGLIKDWSEDQILHGEPCDTYPLPIDRMESSNIKLVFYSRPTVDKNIYEIKVAALRIFIDYVKEHMPDKYKSMEIVGIGEKSEDVLHGDFKIKNLGKIDFSDYPSFLNKFNLGMSCIISPAFAYPCIEFPRAGLVTVVNRFENRDLSNFSKNIVSCDNSAQSIAESLIAAVSMIGDTQSRFDASNFILPGVGIDKATEEMLKNI